VQTIGLADTLTFEPADSLQFRSDKPDWDPTRSLVSKAAALLRETAGVSRGATISVIRRVPLLTGLGGDSSAAAATLRGLNELWGLKMPPADLAALGAKLGSDIPFFVYGGTAFMSGRGEIVEPIPPVRSHSVLVAVPSVARPAEKTKTLYGALWAQHYTAGEITRRLADDIGQGVDFDHSLLFNTFENVAFELFSGLETFRQHFLKLGAPDVHLAGSGPALYTLLDRRSDAEELGARLQQQNMNPYLTETLSGDDMR
jgi:4-diphosphocytidyl-2-C-methyl-D-erythritol kinase